MGYNSELHIQIQDDLCNLSNQASDGELSHLDALIEMRKHREQMEKSLEIIKEFENENLNTIASKAEEYKGKYLGYDIKSVSGKKLYSFKAIPQYQEVEKTKKEIEDKFKSAFEGFQKGTVQTTVVDEVRYWIDEDGELQPFPELSIGKSYLTVTKSKDR